MADQRNRAGGNVGGRDGFPERKKLRKVHDAYVPLSRVRSGRYDCSHFSERQERGIGVTAHPNKEIRP